MTKVERAAETWPVLVAAAHNRQVLTYEVLADTIGMGPPGKGAGTLAHPLGVIMRYCEANALPPLTVLVVNKTTGRPGKGLKTIKELHTDRERVFKHRWYEALPPQIAELKQYD